MYRIIRLFIHSRNSVPDIVPLWLKNQNQRVHGGAGDYVRGNLYAIDTRVKEKVGLSVCVCGGGGGAYRRRNTIFIDSLQPDVHEMTSQNFSILIQDLGVNSNGLFWRVYIC